MRENMGAICLFSAMMLTIFILSGCAAKMTKGPERHGVMMHTCLGLCQFGFMLDQQDGTEIHGQYPNDKSLENLTEDIGDE